MLCGPPYIRMTKEEVRDGMNESLWYQRGRRPGDRATAATTRTAVAATPLAKKAAVRSVAVVRQST